MTSNPKKFRKITMELILASTSLTRSSKETPDAYLQRVTHLHLQGKKIRVIEGLELCTNLKIEVIQNLNFASNLQYLYLHNNFISEIPRLAMPSLRKLYLDENEITEVSGLEECESLEELHLARQRLPSFTALKFDQASLNAIGRTLQVLEISGCGISQLTPFHTMYNLRKLLCKNNQVVDLHEVECVVQLSYLEEANFIGNGCCSLFKYRDITIGAANSNFAMLDEVPIPRHQRNAIAGLMKHRRKIGAISRFIPNTSDSTLDGEFGQGFVEDENSQVNSQDNY